MKVTLSFEKSKSSDVSIVVDALRASTTMTMAFNNFKTIIPTFSPEIARNIAKEKDAVLVGERLGEKLVGFDIGNSPEKVLNYKTNKTVMVITTTNGTRILESINSKILIGAFVNKSAVAKKALELGSNHIDLVMAGRNGEFAIEDYLSCGEIIECISNLDKTVNLDDFALSSLLAVNDKKKVDDAVLNSTSSKVLSSLGYRSDVEFSLKRDITSNVGIFREGKLDLLL